MLQDAVLTAPIESEEITQQRKRMTFQVALVGTDGLLIASDRRSLYTSSESDDDLYSSSQPGECCKIVASANAACAFAGSVNSSSIAEAIVRSPAFVAASNDHELHVAIREIHRGRGILQQNQKDEIIMARARDLGRVIIAGRRGHEEVGFTERTKWICTGNNSIPARFIPHHFYEKRPVAQLERLALLTLACAAWEEKNGVGGGFDVLFLTAGGFSDLKLYVEDDPIIEELRASFESGPRAMIYAINS